MIACTCLPPRLLQNYWCALTDKGRKRGGGDVSAASAAAAAAEPLAEGLCTLCRAAVGQHGGYGSSQRCCNVASTRVHLRART
jgi:hypothetical protein